jgi:hypothetical protein
MTTLGATPWREQMRGTHAFVTTPGMLSVVNATLAGDLGRGHSCEHHPDRRGS